MDCAAVGQSRARVHVKACGLRERRVRHMDPSIDVSSYRLNADENDGWGEGGRDVRRAPGAFTGTAGRCVFSGTCWAIHASLFCTVSVSATGSPRVYGKYLTLDLILMESLIFAAYSTKSIKCGKKV